MRDAGSTAEKHLPHDPSVSRRRQRSLGPRACGSSAVREGEALVNNAELMSWSGPRNPYPGKLGVIEEGAYADILLVNGSPLEKLELFNDPDENLALIMKDGKIYKNTLN